MQNLLQRAVSISIYDPGGSPPVIEAMQWETAREVVFAVTEDISSVGGVIYQIQRTDNAVIQGECYMEKDTHLVYFVLPVNALKDADVTLSCHLAFYSTDAPGTNETLRKIFAGETNVLVSPDTSSSTIVGPSGLIDSFEFQIHVNKSTTNPDTIYETTMNNMLQTTSQATATVAQAQALLDSLQDDVDDALANVSTAVSDANTATSAANTAAATANSAAESVDTAIAGIDDAISDMQSDADTRLTNAVSDANTQLQTQITTAQTSINSAVSAATVATQSATTAATAANDAATRANNAATTLEEAGSQITDTWQQIQELNISELVFRVTTLENTLVSIQAGSTAVLVSTDNPNTGT